MKFQFLIDNTFRKSRDGVSSPMPTVSEWSEIIDFTFTNNNKFLFYKRMSERVDVE